MQKQSYSNHVRYYVPHHFIFYPLLLIAIGLSAHQFNKADAQKSVWLAIIVIFIFIGFTSFMMRQHYALSNQNRIVRMELRFRYYVITGKRLELLEDKLQFAQIAALRFASDDQLPSLVTRAVEENMTSSEIKKSIVNWLPDYMRV